ncbi:multidrug efflux protein [Fictibacillus macauensis ZFHKF-1]|uniref:Probable multidrug resistance protein NorM n=1 Tax=Fictibacillus macauensis ZFHKF-1 TaxID=1196324 RepID=I8ALJ6_9BACL|nr:MATE family efflux transporter [Fictibacillus macauensis]EIT86787.1 multidrug efflux protein [Fictibacillus macauensis ZFHKF-1]
MNSTSNLQQKGALFFRLVLPIFITQIGLYAMNFLDTVMSGHAGAAQLAGVAIGTSIWVPVFTGLSGILTSITPLVSQLNGANQSTKIPYVVIQGIYLAIALALSVIVLGSFVLNPLLDAMHLERAVRDVAHGYIVALSFGMIPLFIYNTLRSFIDALGRTRVTMTITLVALPVNFVINYLLIFGKWGFPKLGGVGSGYASAITYWFITLIALYIVHKKAPFSALRIFKTWFPVSLQAWKTQLKIGIPIGFSIFFETSIFAAVTLFMSVYNTETIAAHQAALNFASFLYMLPLSISFAMTIAVGYEVGAKRFRDARQYSRLGILSALILAVFCATGLYFFTDSIAALYSNNTDVLSLTKHFLLYAIFFQLSDAIAAPIQGALRGYKDVNVTLVLSLISYWVIGLPLGYVLAHYTAIGPYGYWIGLISGLAAGACLLWMRLLTIQRKQHQATPAYENSL